MGSRDWTSARESPSADRRLQARIESELPSLLALARRLTREEHDAEDAVQDALESAWKARGQIREPDAAGGWLRRILARRIVDAHRRRADLPVGAPGELDSLIPDVEDPAAVLAAAEDERVLRAALRELMPADRIALVLHDAEGWPAAEVGQLLGVGTEAAHKRVQRARARLVATLAAPHSPARRTEEACRDARSHVHELLEETLDPVMTIAVQHHLDSCPSCPASLRAAAGVLAALRREGDTAPIPTPLRLRIAGLVREAEEAP
jgi:RNA polymerase sigma-70 factor (ECF subfamily)